MYNVEKEPKTKIIADGNEEILQIKRKKQLDYGDKKKPG